MSFDTKSRDVVSKICLCIAHKREETYEMHYLRSHRTIAGLVLEMRSSSTSQVSYPLLALHEGLKSA
jgi:hypothetical protein